MDNCELLQKKLYIAITILLVSIFFHITNSYAVSVTYSINSTTSKEIEKLIDKSTLVLISIDDTLSTPVSKMFRFENNPYRNFIRDLETKIHSVPSLRKGLGDFLTTRRMMLVEPELEQFVSRIKSSAGLVAGLYYTQMQEKELVKNPEERLYQELAGLNITFTPDIKGENVFMVGSSLNKVLFYKGILFTGNMNKGLAIGELIKILPNTFTKVVVIDNNLNDLERIKYFLRIFDIEFYPLQYLAERKIKGTPNTETVMFQEKTLLENGKWLEDDEAEKLMNEK